MFVFLKIAKLANSDPVGVVTSASIPPFPDDGAHPIDKLFIFVVSEFKYTVVNLPVFGVVEPISCGVAQGNVAALISGPMVAPLIRI